MATTTTSASLNGVAIIGMSGRFPGADNLDAFWRNLCDGVESITSFTDDELRASGVDEATLANPHYVKSGMILNEQPLMKCWRDRLARAGIMMEGRASFGRLRTGSASLWADGVAGAPPSIGEI